MNHVLGTKRQSDWPVHGNCEHAVNRIVFHVGIGFIQANELSDESSMSFACMSNTSSFPAMEVPLKLLGNNFTGKLQPGAFIERNSPALFIHNGGQ